MVKNLQKHRKCKKGLLGFELIFKQHLVDYKNGYAIEINGDGLKTVIIATVLHTCCVHKLSQVYFQNG